MANYRDPKLKVFTCNANPALAKEIVDHIGLPMGNAQVVHFSDGEVQIKLNESVRGADVFVIQSTSAPVNEHLMELLVMVDALKRASAKSINVVIPYYGYARQDRKARARDPITAKLVANLIETAGAHRVITMDLHATQIQGFFDIPVDHLLGVPILGKHFAEKELEDIVVVSPDHGGVTRARKLAERLEAPIAIIDKRRPEPNVAEVMNIVGNIEGRTAIIIDDIIDTAGTITLAANALMEAGAKAVYACCTHPVLSGPAIERIENSSIKELIVTNTIPLGLEKQSNKIQALSVAPIIGEAIIRVHEELSVSKLFD
ncbi:ribose-phosphate diphosphokinase [Aneurinibacillus aneurinilyticus]|jgi:ribose-phosphate pyrophosphokinase|uniref:Ribose-phosphate pyrophosphokinase n=2 Tax=Aneurinibacillus aneurinilyticus TaxID=1391 RepID=A0A848D316_ANEAE|nr:ribose-phosphate diphosphokinase [Aneurinibacillus aneurinilyticus]ERI08771.1 ribose-phosphate diphosphokinase [Aneurinibacillus aneurinilyticus ATCC 12856]MCI1695336.1 ribose-phosphate diphosphokinase [Aneurinibacillus aneurinilyticus]MED0671594.1 ribose-phosphate diphosphokinase [Aneurinibacillus aneurinilyticus]MED0706886.1 ribose-phosphate diphosphokinase [Aneurinibacillus aneurinilyticus]MED0723389.1 ribose-phosphate diphosphokinase [Aneurinibacillus aneurinilyticus]